MWWILVPERFFADRASRSARIVLHVVIRALHRSAEQTSKLFEYFWQLKRKIWISIHIRKSDQPLGVSIDCNLIAAWNDFRVSFHFQSSIFHNPAILSSSNKLANCPLRLLISKLSKCLSRSTKLMTFFNPLSNYKCQSLLSASYFPLFFLITFFLNFSIYCD